MKDAPAEHVLSDGGVLLTVVYDAPLDAMPSSRFIALKSPDGWGVAYFRWTGRARTRAKDGG